MNVHGFLPDAKRIETVYLESGMNNSMEAAHFWEYDNMFVCPAIGMCLTLSEQQQIIKKCGISIKNKSVFEIHELLVACAEGENRLSKRVDNLFRKKFSKSASPLLATSCDVFMQNWRSAFKNGSYVDVFWAAAARPKLPPEYKREIFGDVHMAMHWSAEQNSRHKYKITVMKQKIESLINQAKESAAARRKAKKENIALQREIKELKDRLKFLAAQNRILREKAEETKNQVINDTEKVPAVHLVKEKKDLMISAKEKDARISFLEKEKNRISAELTEHRKLAQRLTDETRAVINELASKYQCSENCPSFDLCRKRFLIVGGLTRMESLYRELIEKSGGKMEYHDGYMKNGTRKLESLLKRADVVLCPISCNSHAACSMVKNLAKKHKKPVHMLNNSSLSAITRAIMDAENNQAVIN